MRAFVAVDVGGGERAAPEHLTLAFLGEIAPERAAALVPALREVGASTAPFTLRLEGVGAFPSADRPRVVWVGATSGRAEVERLGEAVRTVVRREGLPLDTAPFVAHLTLLRVRSAADLRAARELLRGTRPPPPARTVEVRAFALKESQLGPGGARHRVVGTVPLEGTGPTGP